MEPERRAFIESTLGTQLSDEEEARANEAANLFFKAAGTTAARAHAEMMRFLDADDQESLRSCAWQKAEDLAIKEACKDWASIAPDLILAIRVI